MYIDLKYENPLLMNVHLELDKLFEKLRKVSTKVTTTIGDRLILDQIKSFFNLVE